MEPEQQPIDLRDLLWRLRRYGWLLVLPVIICVCGATVYYYKISTPMYASQAVLAVYGSGQAPPAVDPLVGVAMERPNEGVIVVDTRVRSRAFLGILVERLGMNKDPELLAKATEASRRWKAITPEEFAMRMSVSRLSARISVSPGRARQIQIAATDADPEMARRLAEMVAELLLEESRLSTQERVQARGEFSSDQLAVYEERLRKAEAALRDFEEGRLRKGFTLGIITEHNLTRARNLQRSTEDAMEQVSARIQTARNDWREAMGEVPVPDLRSTRVSDDITRLGELETNYGLALLRAGSEDRADSDALQARIAAARQSLFMDFEQLAQGLPSKFTADARGAAAGIALDRAVQRSLAERRDRIASEIATYLRIVEGSPRDELQLQRLRQDVQTSRDFLLSLRRDATSSRISEALASSQLGPRLEIVEYPLLPLHPSSPNPTKIFGLAVLLGPLISGGIVFAGERLASVLRTMEQAESEYGLRVLGTVPRIEGWSSPGSYLEKNWAALAILLTLLLTGLAFTVDVQHRDQKPTADQILGLER